MAFSSDTTAPGSSGVAHGNDGQLAALIGSRICHDLISPIGAIANGLELLELAGHGHGPELDLISDSVTNAGARIRFFRVAYGAAHDQEMSRMEVVSILDDLGRSARLACRWTPVGTVARAKARLAFLSIQCLETAMPLGGEIEVSETESGWTVSGTASKIAIDAELWSRLDEPKEIGTLAPAQVQFALLPVVAREMGRTLGWRSDESSATIEF